MGKRLVVLWNSNLLGLNANNRRFLGVVFIKLKCIWLQNGLDDLKITKNFKFSLR